MDENLSEALTDNSKGMTRVQLDISVAAYLLCMGMISTISKIGIKYSPSGRESEPPYDRGRDPFRFHLSDAIRAVLCCEPLGGSSLQ